MCIYIMNFLNENKLKSSSKKKYNTQIFRCMSSRHKESKSLPN